MKSILSDNSLMDCVANAIVRDADGNDNHLPDGFRLPELENENLSKFADGAIDGIYIYHTAHQPVSKEAKDVLAKAMKAVGKGDRAEAKALFEDLGLSDEFTLFVIFIMQQWENANEEIFRLAKKTKGWGRIHAIERLIPDTPEIREWLLREGIRNKVLPAYSALNCWEGSEAENLLFAPEISQEDFAAISELISVFTSRARQIG